MGRWCGCGNAPDCPSSRLISNAGLQRRIGSAQTHAVSEHHDEGEGCRQSAEAQLRCKWAPTEERKIEQTHGQPTQDTEHKPFRDSGVAWQQVVTAAEEDSEHESAVNEGHGPRQSRMDCA